GGPKGPVIVANRQHLPCSCSFRLGGVWLWHLNRWHRPFARLLSSPELSFAALINSALNRNVDSSRAQFRGKTHYKRRSLAMPSFPFFMAVRLRHGPATKSLRHGGGNKCY